MKIPNLVDVLFDALNVENKDDNPFECEAANKLFDDFCEKYIYGMLTDLTVSNDAYLELVGIILEEQKKCVQNWISNCTFIAERRINLERLFGFRGFYFFT